MVKPVISDLLHNMIGVSLLVVSKAYTKTNYENKQAHSAKAEKLRKRDSGTALSLGNREPLVIVKEPKNQPVYPGAEDSTYALEGEIPIDKKYHLEHMLRTSFERISGPV